MNHISVFLRKRLAEILRQWLARLEAVDTKDSTNVDLRPVRLVPTPSPAPVAPLRAQPVKSNIEVRASSENPRPKRGREKLREQLHFAHCCGEHGCKWKDPDCPLVAEGPEAVGYFPCAFA